MAASTATTIAPGISKSAGSFGGLNAANVDMLQGEMSKLICRPSPNLVGYTRTGESKGYLDQSTTNHTPASNQCRPLNLLADSSTRTRAQSHGLKLSKT